MLSYNVLKLPDTLFLIIYFSATIDLRNYLKFYKLIKCEIIINASLGDKAIALKLYTAAVRPWLTSNNI